MVKIPNNIYKLINNIRSDLKIHYNIQPSDRRYKESIKVLKAFSYLNHHTGEVRIEDLSILEHIYWQTRDRIERENIQKVVYKCIGNKEVVQVTELYHQLQKLYQDAVQAIDMASQKNMTREKERKEFEQLSSQVREIEQQMISMMKELKALMKSCALESGKAVIENYIQQTESMHQKLLSKQNVAAFRQFWGEKLF
ncbi:hypothetical protein HY745_05975 [Candidatus Desantisbacteria bacterium]|nr:hypothetical protein [Candidatus Desantisbacteria bacterium]